MELEFFGAAGEVTGSCHILRVNGYQVLLDCGLIQGGRKAEARNAEPFPFDATQIDAVVLSHAHIDHSGRLPLLARRGFAGKIYTHNASKDLCGVMLRDSARLQEWDVERENRRRKRRGKSLREPLYTSTDAERALKTMRGLRYQEKHEVVPGITVQFRDAGHIMGSSIVEVWMTEGDVQRKLVFSGDLGQHDAPILRDPQPIDDADLVLMESTYGGRRHRNRDDTEVEIGEIIKAAGQGKGNIMIPAFAVGRSQDLLYMFGTNAKAWDMNRWRVFLDSPMAVQASEIYWDYPHLYDGEATKFRKDVFTMPIVDRLHLTPSPDESRVINKVKSGAIIIAGSGMCNGGRILHHFRHNLWRKECHVIIVGYQARGSLGRRLVDGKKTVKIHREPIRVKAQVHTVGGLSAHGDEDDLARWYGSLKNHPPVYLVHGERRSGERFRSKLVHDYKTDVTLADPGMKVDLASIKG